MITLMTREAHTEQSGQALAADQAVYEMRLALSYPHDVHGFDELLNAVGAHRSNYLQAANRKKIVAALSSGEWLMLMSEDSDEAPLNVCTAAAEPSTAPESPANAPHSILCPT